MRHHGVLTCFRSTQLVPDIRSTALATQSDIGWRRQSRLSDIPVLRSALQSWCCEPLAVSPYNAQPPTENTPPELQHTRSPRHCWQRFPDRQAGPAFPR